MLQTQHCSQISAVRNGGKMHNHVVINILIYAVFVCIAEYCTRRKFVDAAPDKFLKILLLVGSVYNPNRALELANQQQSSEQELLPQQQNTTAAAATATTELPQASVNTDFAIFLPTDITNFDLRSKTPTVTTATSTCSCNAVSANVVC